MDEWLWWAIAGISVVLLVSIAIVLAWLWRQQQKHKLELRELAAQLQRSSDDLAGLCSAAVAVDQRLAVNESRLNKVLENLSVPPAQPEPLHQDVVAEEEPQAQGYQLAIEKIRQGANVEDLMKSCGLTRDEAMLLVRLHGKR